jgi:hypothetical protein
MGRSIFAVALLIILSYHLDAQSSLSPIDKYLLVKQKNTSPDQLFVHLDRNNYKPGDTIYFQGYIRDRFTNEFESKSVSLYALLFDNNRKTIDSSRFKIENSTCSGWMSIPPGAKRGKYHFVAFTSNMQNLDPSEAFHTDLLVKGADKIPGENETSSDSELFGLSFLPEGGNSVQGLEQKIGFNATDGKGYPVHIKGLLKNSFGSTIDTIESGDYGPGYFVCTPEPGMSVEITEGPGKGKRWRMPDPKATGIGLSVKTIDNRSFSVDIQSSYYNNDTLTVAGVMNTNLVFLQNLTLNKRQRIVVQTDQLPSGVVQITVFSKDLRPLAERLYYVNSDKRIVFNIVARSPISAPGRETELTISVSDGLGNPSSGIFSISVADSVSDHTTEIDTPGIESALDYNPFFQMDLPQKVHVTGFENLSDEERDLMLMVYGREKFTWDFTNQKITLQDLTNYDLLNIKVVGVSAVHPSVRKLDLISLEDPTVMHLKTNKAGDIFLVLDSLPAKTKSVTLLPVNRANSAINGVMWSIPYSEQYLNHRSFFTSQQSDNRLQEADKPSLNKPEIIDKSNGTDLKRKGITDQTFELPEVTITSAKKYEYKNKYEEAYKYTNVKSLSHDQLSSSNSMAEAIRRIVNPYIMEEADAFHPGAAIYLRPSHSFFGGNVKVMFVLDGVPLHDDFAWQKISDLHPDQIASISVLEGSQSHVIYGEEALGGVIFVNTYYPGHTKMRTDWKSQNKTNNLLTPIAIYRQNVEFYNTAGSEIEDNRDSNGSSTVYWNPEVYFNGKEPVKIKYLNHNYKGPVIITINGVSFNNLIGTGRESYWVR